MIHVTNFEVMLHDRNKIFEYLQCVSSRALFILLMMSLAIILG